MVLSSRVLCPYGLRCKKQEWKEYYPRNTKSSESLEVVIAVVHRANFQDVR